MAAMSADSKLLAEYVEDAARQRLWLESWIEDRAFAMRGGKLFYSVDTDIIILHLNPAENAVPAHEKSGRREGYTKIFRHDDNYVAIALGRAIANFIFYNLIDTALLVPPPLEQEIANIYFTLINKADKEQRDVKRDLRANLPQLESAIAQEPDNEKKIDLLMTRVPQLINFLLGESGPSAELRLLAELLEESPVGGIEYLASKITGPSSEGIASIIASPTSLGDWFLFSKYNERWEERLRSHPSKSTRRVDVIESDAKVLARVEFLNVRLRPMNCRLVHITGDNAIHDLGSNYFPTDENKSFADLYLRHPRSFLAEEKVLFSVGKLQTSQEQFLNWFEVFLADYADSKGDVREKLRELLRSDSDRLREMAAKVLAQDPQAVVTVQRTWQEFTRALSLKQLGASRGEQREALRDAASNFETLLETLGELVEVRVRSTWESCFAAATATGLSLVNAGEAETPRPKRGIPPIIFDKLHEAANEFVRVVQESVAPTAARGDLRNTYRTLVEQLREEDESGYLYYLTFALLFAAHTKWNVAALLVDRAINIAEKKPASIPGTKISGREAYYLRAAAQRLLSVKIGDFAIADAFLDKAVNALSEDQDFFAEHKVTSLRFDAERLANELGRHLFVTFAGQPEEESQEVAPLADLPKRTVDLLVASASETDPRVRVSIQRSLLVNLLMTVLLLIDRGELARGQDNLNQYRLHYEEFKVGMLDIGVPNIPRTYLHESVLLASRCIFDPPTNNAERKRMRQEIEAHFLDTEIKRYSVTCYDEKRFQFLKKFCLKTLTSSSPH